MDTTSLEQNAPSLPNACVRANVNERKFFASMKHLFASSFSVMGELLQNSRRAKASAVRIFADFQTNTLCIEDDGTGIDDFGKLLELSSSGWDDETMLKETPFGMGFFSCFTSADQVEVRSKGKVLKATLADVVEGRHIALEKDTTTPPTITSVTLINVSGDVMDRKDVHRFTSRLKELVRGFDIPVFLNDEELARPDALENVPGVRTTIGHVSVNGIHRGDKAPVGSFHGSDVTLYLQGLPINRSSYSHFASNMIIHLDSESFIAQMPDRNRLYDSDVQTGRIYAAITEVLKAHLLERKQNLPEQEFVTKYWHAAKQLKMLSVMNDIKLVPQSIFDVYEAAVINTDYENTTTQLNTDVFFSESQFDQGSIRAIIDVPTSADMDAWASAMMKLMQREKIFGINSRDIDADHWLFKKLMRYENMRLRAVPTGEKQRQESYGWGDKATSVRMADSVELVISLIAKDGQEQEVMKHTVRDDWLLVPLNQDEELYDETDCIVWLLGDKDKSFDNPVNALCTFYDEHDAYREEWETNAKLAWSATVSNLRDLHTVINVARVMNEHYLQIPEYKSGEFGIVRIERHSHGDGEYGHPKLAFDPVTPKFMANLTTALQLETGHKDLDVKQITRALLAVVRPDLYVGGPRDGDHIGQW